MEKYVLWFAKSDNSLYKIKINGYSMTLVVISQKELTTREMIKQI
jgi:hypothetical protein